MANCVVHPIPICQGKRDKCVFTYLHNFGLKTLVGQYVWYIEGTKEKILVDAGSSAEYAAKLGQPYQEVQTLEAGMKKLGLSPGDIDLVIMTQLHYDHVAQAAKLPRARFLVQKDELEFARNPHPIFASAYSRAFLEGLKFEVIDGDARICDEVSVIKTPGHTAGGQSVVIKTAKGKVVISGLCTIRENFEPPPVVRQTMPVIAPGIHINVIQAYENVLKVKNMADIVIAIHDAEYLEKATVP